MTTIQSQIDGNTYQVTLLKAMAAGLVALISLSQLGSVARFGSGGPRAILPLSVSAVVVAAVLFGLSYGNYSYTTAQLNARLALPDNDPNRVTRTNGVPTDVATCVSSAKAQMAFGVIFALVAVGLYLSSVWWPK